MKKILLLLLVQSICHANIYDSNTDAIASPRDLSLNSIEAGGLYTDAQTTSVKNYVLTSLSGQDRLWTFTTTSLLVLENTTLELDGTFTFSHGSIKIVGNCAINGSSDFNKFRFESNLIHIENNSELRIGPGVNFEYAPTSSIITGIRFGSSSSKLILEDATLTVSNRQGLNLINGELRIEGNSTVDNFFTEDNVQYLDTNIAYTETALFLGYGPGSYGDCKLNITSGSKLTVKNAGIVYRNNGSSFDGANSNGSLVIDKKGSFLVHGDADFNGSGISLDISKFSGLVKTGITTSVRFVANYNFSTNVSADANSCHLSSDGKYLAVVGNTFGAGQIDIFTLSGDTLTFLVRTDYFASVDVASSCRWSPDGKYLAVIGYTGTTNQVQVYSFDGTSLVSLGPSGNGWDYYQSGDSARACDWSPDGKYLVVVGSSGITNQVQLYRFDGSNLISLGNWDYYETNDTPLSCVWSSDGKNIFIGGRTFEFNQVQIYSFNDGSLTYRGTYNYNKSGDYLWSCDLSADGKYLAAVGVTGDSSQIEIYNFDTSSTTSLTSIGNWTYYENSDTARSCSWSPDGNYLIVAGNTEANNQVEVFNFNGTTITPVGTANFGSGVSDQIYGSSWTSDGKHICVSGLIVANSGIQTALYKLDTASDHQKVSSFKDATIKLEKDLTLRDINLKMK